MRRVILTLALAGLLVTVLVPAAVGAEGKGQGAPVDIQFLNISDWHAQLDPLFVFPVGNFGGAAELSTYFQQERANNPNTLTLTAGDAYGGRLLFRTSSMRSRPFAP